MHKPTLLIIYPNQFGYHTDTFKYCEYLCCKFDITYICFDQGYEKLDINGIKVEYLPYNIVKIVRLFNYLRFIVLLTHKKKTDILFVVRFKFCFLLGIFCKTSVKVLDFRTGDLSRNSIKRKIKNLCLWFDSLFFENTSVISEGLRKILYLKKKTLILPLGSDVINSNFHEFNRINLLYVGSLNNRNIHETIDGVAIFLNNYPHCKPLLSYIIIGFGKEDVEEKIKKTISSNNLDSHVFFMGKKKYTDLAEYFEKCNIGVAYLPVTPYYNHQPATKTFEYAMSGLFSIATDTYENRKVINKDNGVLCCDTPVSFADALGLVLNKLKEIDETKIRASLINYKWNTIVNDILEPYLFTKLNQYSEN